MPAVLPNAELFNTCLRILCEYSDKDQIENCKDSIVDQMKAGYVVVFGNYQGSNLSWRILTKEGNSVLLITQGCVEKKHFQFNQNDPKYYKDSLVFQNENTTDYEKGIRPAIWVDAHALI